jgi:hypothetical protein
MQNKKYANNRFRKFNLKLQCKGKEVNAMQKEVRNLFINYFKRKD